MSQKAYEKIYNELLTAMQSGALAEGTRLQTEEELAAQYAVSRSTARRAVDTLFREGFVYRIPKRGTFVAKRRGQENKKVAVVLPYEESNNFRIVDAIMDGNLQYVFDIDLFKTNRNSKTERDILQKIYQSHYDGMILLPSADTENMEIISRLAIRKMPIVLVDLCLMELDFPIVTSDNQKGFYTLVEAYIKNGYQKIAYAVVTPQLNTNCKERLKGYCAALVQNGIPLRNEYLFETDRIDRKFYYYSGEEQEQIKMQVAQKIYQEFRTMQAPPEVICFNNDVSAADFIRYCHSIGVDIQREIIITGFDNLQVSRDLHFTTVQQNFYRIGKKALEMLVRSMRGESVDSIVLPTKLIMRGMKA